MSSENGNGKLTYPVALLTSDEINMAGGATSSNNSYYLNTRELWWSLSPYNFSTSSAIEFRMNTTGSLAYFPVNVTSGVRPSIVLAHDLLVERGTGTSENPYELVLE